MTEDRKPWEIPISYNTYDVADAKPGPFMPPPGYVPVPTDPARFRPSFAELPEDAPPVPPPDQPVVAEAVTDSPVEEEEEHELSVGLGRFQEPPSRDESRQTAGDYRAMAAANPTLNYGKYAYAPNGFRWAEDLPVKPPGFFTRIKNLFRRVHDAIANS